MTHVQLTNIEKSFNKQKVIYGVDLSIDSGEFIVFVGPSGCGKSTLLNLMAGLDSPSEGEVLINNINISNLKERQRTELRAKNLGFVSD